MMQNIKTLLFPINEKAANGRGVLGKISLPYLSVTVQNSWAASSVQNMKHGAKTFYTSMVI